MEYRNAKYNSDGVTIDCEINHSVHGWIPFTASPNDTNGAGALLHNIIVADGNVAAADPIDIPSVQVAAKNKIDIAAERARQRHITPGDGQSMTYRIKAEEARAYKDAGYPADMTEYPFVDAEAAATGETATATADAVIAQEDAWKAIGASIEGARLGGKKDVDDAADVSSIESVRDSAIAVLDAI